MLRLFAILATLLGVLVLGFSIRLFWWILRGGSRVVVPWHDQGMPSSFSCSQRLRTRDGSRLTLREPGYCALLIWKAPRAFVLLDRLTGSTGVRSVAADFSHTCGKESWLITSHAIGACKWNIDGPHFVPLSACDRSGRVRVEVSSLIDAQRLLTDLERSVYRSSIRHRGLDPLGYLLGITRTDKVTCSGLIGGAILRQAGSPLAEALRQALRQRLTYGEITPTDLARAAAILKLVPEGAPHAIVTVPVVTSGRASADLTMLGISS
jgi:hypothetical protein